MSPVPTRSTATTEDLLQTKQVWNKHDTLWMLGLFGTAIGAGILFLPINAGAGGLLPLFIIALIALPITFYSHRGLTRFVLSGTNPRHDITHVAQEHFGTKGGSLVTLCYFFSIFPVLLMYSVAITNTCASFIVHQLHCPAPPRAVLAAVLLGGLLWIITVGQAMIVRFMSLLVYPFVISLLLLSLYLIPQWSLQNWSHAFLIVNPGISSSWSLINSLWLLLPLLIFSFNHAPIISSFALVQRERYGADAEQKTGSILIFSHLLMVFMVMFFVFSCVLSLTPDDLAHARSENISILSYLANHFDTPVIAYAAPVIAFIAIAKSFLGHYLGAREGLQGLWINKTQVQHTNRFRPGLVDGIMIGVCWLIATLNPSILGMIENLAGPVIAIILLLMPVYALYYVPELRKYQYWPRDVFIGGIGLVAVGAKLASLF